MEIQVGKSYITRDQQVARNMYRKGAGWDCENRHELEGDFSDLDPFQWYIDGAFSLDYRENSLDLITEVYNNENNGWITVNTIPRDGTKIDVWAVDPDTGSIGVRFTDVQMRGDGSGFGFVYHTENGAQWEYLESYEGIYPKWIIKYWRNIPERPTL